MGKIHRLVRDTKELEKQILELKKQYDDNKAEIQKYFDEKKLKTIEVNSESQTLIVNKIESYKIEYFLDKLKENLGKDIYSEIVDKAYVVRDMETLKELAKKAGMSPKALKECLEVTETLNKAQLNQLYSIGDIKKQDIKGCYKVTISKRISIKEKKE